MNVCAHGHQGGLALLCDLQSRMLVGCLCLPSPMGRILRSRHVDSSQIQEWEEIYRGKEALGVCI